MDELFLSRLQFGLTAMYHFLFVPLTMGLSVILAIMETIYVRTSQKIYKDMVKFFGVLFGINFAMGVATGITLEFQFGTNWSYYSHYVGDIFGAILAIEGLMAFFLEATFIGLFFFAWNKLSKKMHLMVTWLLALGTNLSAFWILIANGWMENPKGAYFNIKNVRMELDSFFEIVTNPVAISKFFHTLCSGYVTGSVFVCTVSLYFLLKKRHIELAKNSLKISFVFGFISSSALIFFGDSSGYLLKEYQPMKLAGIEGMWETESAPASFSLIGIPDVKNQTNHYEIKIPYVLGLIATRSLNEEIKGIKDLVEINKTRIRNGKIAYISLKKLQENPDDALSKEILNKNIKDLGYGMLLNKVQSDLSLVNEDDIERAASLTIPNVTGLYFAFRIMVGIGFLLLLFFALGTFSTKLWDKTWFQRFGIMILPCPWIAAELGWYVCENGRQPWAIHEILPTFMASSALDRNLILVTLIGFIIFYTSLLIIDVYLMIKTIKQGPNYLD